MEFNRMVLFKFVEKLAPLMPMEISSKSLRRGGSNVSINRQIVWKTGHFTTGGRSAQTGFSKCTGSRLHPGRCPEGGL